MTDLTDLLKGSVADVTALLGALTTDELVAAHDIEEKGKNRRTMLDAIHAEQKAREEAAALQAQFDNAKAVLLGDDGEDAKVAALVELAAAFKVALPTPGDLTTLRDRLAVLEERLGILTEAQAEAPALAGEAVQIAWRADAGHDSEFFLVAFTDGEDVTLAPLPRLRFAREQLRFVGNSATLLPEVVLPETGQRTNVLRVWLLDDEGSGLAVCKLMAPLPAGGGQSGRFGPQSLLFLRDA